MGYGYQTDLALGLALGPTPGGIIPYHDLKSVALRLQESVVAHDKHLSTGMFGTKVLLPALSSTGYGDIAMDVLTQTTSPGWGAWVVADEATTLFEMWGAYNGQPPSSGIASHNHVMFSTFMPWLYQIVAGIVMDGTDDFGIGVLPSVNASSLPLKPVGAYSTFKVRPRLLGSLMSTSASLITMRGVISSSWRRSESVLWLNATIPIGNDAEVSIPLVPRGKCTATKVQIREGKSLVWSGPRGGYMPGSIGVVHGEVGTNDPEGGSRVAFVIGSGRYSFSATCSETAT